jgi:hypothetical protein
MFSGRQTCNTDRANLFRSSADEKSATGQRQSPAPRRGSIDREVDCQEGGDHRDRERQRPESKSDGAKRFLVSHDVHSIRYFTIM